MSYAQSSTEGSAVSWLRRLSLAGGDVLLPSEDENTRVLQSAEEDMCQAIWSSGEEKKKEEEAGWN